MQDVSPENQFSLQGWMVAALNGRTLPDRSGEDSIWQAEFQKLSLENGVTALLFHRLQASDQLHCLPPASATFLKEHAAGSRLACTLLDRQLGKTLLHLKEAGIPLLLLKGAALAHTVYDLPDTRPRLDADLLIPGDQVSQADETLIALGYRKQPVVEGDLIMYQTGYTLPLAGGVHSVVDLHWKISNAQALAESLTFHDLMDKSRAVPFFTCLSPGPVDSLLLAALHLAGHHRNSRRWIWLYDLHLLADSLEDKQRSALFERALSHRLTHVCQHALQATAELLDSAPCQDLASAMPLSKREPSSSLLVSGHDRATVLLSDFWALGSWRRRLRWLRQNLFPPARYMLRRYRKESRLWLPWLYGYRLYHGFLRKPESGKS